MFFQDRKENHHHLYDKQALEEKARTCAYLFIYAIDKYYDIS
jgi:hypothetical protein